MNWKLSYAIGFHPWEDTDQEFSNPWQRSSNARSRGVSHPTGVPWKSVPEAPSGASNWPNGAGRSPV